VPLPVLVVGNITSQTPYLKSLEKRYTVQVSQSGQAALKALETFAAKLVVVDAASMKTTGTRICKKLRQTMPKCPIIHIHTGGKSIKTSADVQLRSPVTGRRLVNSIERLINRKEEETIECGPFLMHTERRLLVAHGKEIQLTPKQAQLLEVFLRRPGETVPRDILMKKVWDTTYLGDTRTLDVHIRWIRKALELDSKKPRYLKTVRGIGYQLVLPD